MGVCSTVGVFSIMEDIMMHVGDILSTVGVFSTVADIMINVGIPHMYHDIPHGTEYPPRYSR